MHTRSGGAKLRQVVLATIDDAEAVPAFTVTQAHEERFTDGSD
jgi:hypothetical protein